MHIRGITLREQIMSVSLDEARGTIQGPCVMQLLNAATLGELLIRRRLVLADGVRVRDASSTGETTLNGALAAIAAADRPHPLSWWARVLHTRPPVPRDAVLVRLVLEGLLSLDEAIQMGLVPMDSYPMRGAALLRELETAVRAALHSSGSPDERTAVLVSLLGAGKLTDRLLGKAAAYSTRERSCTVIDTSPIACAIRRALAEATGIPPLGFVGARSLPAGATAAMR